MNKIYGYKEKDVIGLMQFIKEHNELNLSEIFSLYGKQTKKAKGTVRNLYYAIVKKSRNDSGFRKEYLSDTPIAVNSIVPFTDDEERELVRNILVLTSKGNSVRQSINILAKGDDKLALRYQNKYRNTVKCNHSMVEQISEELAEKGIKVKDMVKSKKTTVSDNLMSDLRREINKLVERIGATERKENLILRQRILSLEKENLRLSRQLYGRNDNVNVEEFFKGNINKKVQN